VSRPKAACALLKGGGTPPRGSKGRLRKGDNILAGERAAKEGVIHPHQKGKRGGGTRKNSGD